MYTACVCLGVRVCMCVYYYTSTCMCVRLHCVCAVVHCFKGLFITTLSAISNRSDSLSQFFHNSTGTAQAQAMQSTQGEEQTQQPAKKVWMCVCVDDIPRERCAVSVGMDGVLWVWMVSGL